MLLQNTAFSFVQPSSSLGLEIDHYYYKYMRVQRDSITDEVWYTLCRNPGLPTTALHSEVDTDEQIELLSLQEKM